jgi:hypothetical protein
MSQSIDLFNRPGSTIVSENNDCNNGLVNYINNPVTECKSTVCNINMPDIDAKRRVRSAGMFRKKYDPTKNNSTYCTDSTQYLVSRNKTFSQNQYNFIRQGNSQAKPGSSLSNNNLYSPNGISHCIQPYISIANNNNFFQYSWIDGKTYDVTIPDGNYDIILLNSVFQNAMLKNNTYFIYNTGNIFLFNLTYDNLNNIVSINITPYRDFITLENKLENQYRVNTPCSWVDSNGNVSTVNTSPAVIIPQSNFKYIIG